MELAATGVSHEELRKRADCYKTVEEDGIFAAFYELKRRTTTNQDSAVPSCHEGCPAKHPNSVRF